MHRRTFLFASAALGAGLFFGPQTAIAKGRTGQFVGKTGHIAKGSGTLTDMGVSLANDFWFDGAPDPRVGLGRSGTFDPATDMGALRRNAGAQLYGLPRRFAPEDYNEIYVWCRRFSVPLAVARIA
ncbi:MAG: DM13 domain-containing protein [Pseudomonadota bacterium]